MKYDELIKESLEELSEIEKKQKLVQFEKRVRFLILLKSREATTQKEAGSRVGWKQRQSQKIWQIYRQAGLVAVLKASDKRGFGKLSSVQISRLNEYLRNSERGVWRKFSSIWKSRSASGIQLAG